MTDENKEQTKLVRQSSKQAIALAMEGRWREAVSANKNIIASFPDDVDAYNRLGRAHMELGEYALARNAYRQAKELDLHNAIAERNLRRLSHLGESVSLKDETFHRVEPQHFIEETGKAAAVRLYHLAPSEVLAKMVAGDRVHLKIEGSSLVVVNDDGENLGRVESGYAQRLVKLAQGGNLYSASVISASEDKMAVIIREVYQHPSQEGQLSFPPRGAEGLKHYIVDEPGYPAEGNDEAEFPGELITDSEEEKED